MCRIASISLLQRLKGSMSGDARDFNNVETGAVIVYIVVVLCVFVCCYLMFICCTMYSLLFFTFDAGLLARSQYSEGPATGHLDTNFSWFHCVYKQVLRWFPRFKVATTCFSCSPPDLNSVVTNFMFCIHVN